MSVSSAVAPNVAAHGLDAARRRFVDDVGHRFVRRGLALTFGRVLGVLLIGVILVACSQQPFTLEASGPFAYSTAVDPPFERVAILVTITDRSGDDLVVNPADFVARDTNHHVYPANPTAAVADASAVRLAYGMQRGTQGISPLPAVTLRQDDSLSGYVVFDVPAGVRPVEVIWRQVDTDYVVHLAAGR